MCDHLQIKKKLREDFKERIFFLKEGGGQEAKRLYCMKRCLKWVRLFKGSKNIRFLGGGGLKAKG